MSNVNMAAIFMETCLLFTVFSNFELKWLIFISGLTEMILSSFYLASALSYTACHHIIAI